MQKIVYKDIYFKSLINMLFKKNGEKFLDINEILKKLVDTYEIHRIF